MTQSRSSISSGSQSGKIEQLENFPARIKPAHSVIDYNNMGVAGDKIVSLMCF